MPDNPSDNTDDNIDSKPGDASDDGGATAAADGAETDDDAAVPAISTAALSLSLRSRPRLADRTTRKPLSGWDRSKFLVLLLSLFGFYLWSKLEDNPILSVRDAFWETVSKQAWVLVLLAIEIVRQLHHLVAEHWSRYYLFFRDRVFARFDRVGAKLDPWTRFRLARVGRWLLLIAVVSIVVGQRYDQSPVRALMSLPGRVHDALPFALQILVYPLLGMFQFVAIFWFLSRGGVETYFPDDIETRFEDVWGQDHVRDRVRENLIFLENPESVEARGGYTPGGILLYGPPGTGKTLIAEAAAGETGKPFVFVEPGAFINMFFGVGVLKVKSLFRKLRKLALRYGGVVVFFDEADSLGNRGIAKQGGFQSSPAAQLSLESTRPGSDLPYLSDATQTALYELAVAQSPSGVQRDGIVMTGMGGGGMGTLQSLLAELSGLKKPRGFFNRTIRKLLGMRPKPPPRYRILVMLASNLPEALDEAMLRPGRIDRIYKVGYPNKQGRIKTYEGYFAKVRHELSASDIEKLATMTPYATGAIIKDLVNEALINAIRDGREVINWADVVKAKQLKDHGLADDTRYVDHERHAIAIHEACHAVAAYRTRDHMMIDIATIEGRASFLGLVSSVRTEDRFTRWRTEYEHDIMVSLASLAGERMFFGGDNSSGVSGDLRNATNVATMMMGNWGMGTTIASLESQQLFGVGGGGPRREGDDEQPPRAPQALGERVETSLREMYERVEQLLVDNRIQVLAVAHALETHLTITGDDVGAIIDASEGPFIDGAGYYRNGTDQKLEAYHAAVLEYRAKGLEELPPLPEIEGVTGRIVSSVARRALREQAELEPVGTVAEDADTAAN